MPEITALLRQEHDEALTLADRLCQEEDDAKARREIFHQLKEALTLHSRAEEAAVYEALKDCKDDEEAVKMGHEGYVEHALVDYLFEKLTRSSATTSPSWSAHAMVLKELLEHHVEEEQGEAFELLDKHFDAAEREKMAAAFLAAKETAAAGKTPRSAA